MKKRITVYSYVHLIMKISVPIMLMLLLAGMTYARSGLAQDMLNRKVTIQGESQELKSVLNQLSKAAGVRFSYVISIVNNRKVTISAKNEKLVDVLEKVLTPLRIRYYVASDFIVLYKESDSRDGQEKVPAEMEINKSSGYVPSVMEKSISGQVTAENGEVLPGVSILIKGTQVGTTTDGGGRYTIKIPDNESVLVFSFMGYQAFEAEAGSSSQLNVSLKTDTKALKEVVVVGYGTQSKSSITGSVASVSNKSIQNQPLSSLDQALAGQVAGVSVAQTNGGPGGGVTVRVRGTGSIGAGNEPLYVIDGFPVTSDYNDNFNPLSSINPSDIESMEILKDASAAAIYGSRGSNGVVLITTKRGKSGKPVVQLDTYFGVQQVANKIKMLDAREYATYNTEARNNAWKDRGGNASDPNELRPAALQIPPMFMNPESLGKGTDWQDEIFRNAPIQNYQLSVSGGNDNTRYFVSGTYFNQDGIVMNTGFDRYSLRVNLDTKISDKIRFGVNLAPTFSSNKLLPVDDQVFSSGILASALSLPPTVPVYNTDGSYTTLLGPSPYNIGVIDNPVAIANKIKNKRSAFRSLGSVYSEFDILAGLKLRVSLGIDYSDSRESLYAPSDLGKNGVIAPVLATAEASAGRDINWLNENILTYRKIFNEKHNFDFLAGFTSQKARSEYTSLSATNFPNDLVTTLNAGQVTTGGTGQSEWSLLSYLGRVNYSYANKYLLSATVRRDGSSRFGAQSKWGTFPSASIGWQVTEEDFFKNQRVFSDFKVRASYGLAGNNTIGNYNHIGLLTNRRYTLGAGTGNVVYGLYPTSISNEQLSWEVMNQMDIGLDFGLLRNRINITVDYYNKNTTHLLLNVPVPASTGYETAVQNIGKLNNKGWEFSVSSKNLINDFKWSTSFNISFNRNKVLALGPEGNPIISKSPGFSPNSHITKIGEPIGSYWGYDAIGIYQSAEEVLNSPSVAGSAGSKPGDLKFRDVDGDKKITPNDITIIGNAHPDFFYGMTNNLSYKGFDLSVLVDGVQGLELLNGGRRNISLVGGSYSRRDVLGRWQSAANPGDGKTPRANTVPTGGNVGYVSSILVEDASFLRIRNINLRYSLPVKATKALFVQKASVYVSAQNAFTFTRYLGFNPEQSFNGSSSLTPGVDYNGYPLAKTFTLGLTLTF